MARGPFLPDSIVRLDGPDGEMYGLLEASKKDRHGVRDILPLLMMSRHDLRVSQAVVGQRQALNLERAGCRLHCIAPHGP